MKKILALLLTLFSLNTSAQQWDLTNNDLTIQVVKNSTNTFQVGKWLSNFAIVGDSVSIIYQRNQDNSHFTLYLDKDSVNTPSISSSTALYDTLVKWTIGDDVIGITPPDTFEFTSQTGVAQSTLTSSNTIILAGDSNSVWAFVVRGDGAPEMSVNGDSFAHEGIARKGDTLQLRLTSSGAPLITSTATLYTNNYSTTFSVITADVKLLDTYGANCAAAYSLRLIRTAYAGAAVRVRRTDNTETDIGFSGGNFDTTALKTFTGANSGFITTWYDQTGNTQHLTQTTNGNQPRIVNAGVVDRDPVTGWPAIYSSGAVSAMSLFKAFTLNQPVNFFLVWHYVSYTATEQTVVDGYGALAMFRHDASLNNRMNVYAGATMTSTIPVATGNTYLMSVLWDGASSNVWQDGASFATGNAGTNNPSGVMLFNYQGDGRPINGYISEFITYSASQTANLTGINGDMNGYYVIY